MADLCYLSATEAMAAFRARELSPVELLGALWDRTDIVEPYVNAFTEQLRDFAVTRARESEARYSAGDPLPLDGLPVALKEEQPIAGRTLEEGSLLLRGEIAEQTHPVAERVLAAGAVVHARSATPEFSCAPFTHSALWGITRNPWNLDASPGGSSGGAGAALAGGMTTLATGSDIGGSIRIPASFTGVVGFKPPHGRVPGMAPFNQDTYCADGPMGRSVADVVLLQNVLAGPWSGDQASLRPTLRLPAVPPEVTGLRVALCMNLGDFPVDPEVAANTRASAAALAAAGVDVEEVDLPWSRGRVNEIAWAHFGSLFGASIAELTGDDHEQLMPYTRQFAKIAAEHASADARLGGLVAETEVYQPLGALLERFDALLCPTTGALMLPAGDDLVDPGHVMIDGTVHPWVDAMMTMPFNVVGRVPVLALPSGISRAGVPTGVQLVGRTFDDSTVFALGAALESAQPRWDDPAWRPTL